MIILLSWWYTPAIAEHQTLSIGIDLAGPSAPHKRFGFELEIWLYPWWAIGTGREVDLGLDEKNFTQSADTNQALSLRFQFSGFFIKFSSLERQHTIKKKDASNPAGTDSEPERKTSLTGTRTSVGYWLEWDPLFFSVGYFQETLSTHEFTFNDESTKTVGGGFSYPFLTVGFAF